MPKKDPDYRYTWPRDAALVVKALVEELRAGAHDLEPVIDDYVASQARMQTVISLSGSLYTGAGLGEPKFNVDERRFNGAWGRPQRDGPALRAIAMMEYVEWLLECGKVGKAKEIVWPVVRDAC